MQKAAMAIFRHFQGAVPKKGHPALLGETTSE